MSPAWGDEDSTIRVKVSTSAADQAEEARLQNCLQREIKRFTNVEIVTDTAKWELVVIASRSSEKFGLRPIGRLWRQDFVFSVLVLTPSGYNGVPRIEDHRLMTGFPNLQDGCERIVKDFAGRYLKKDTSSTYEKNLRDYYD